MGRSCYLRGFLVMALLFLSLSHGFGRVLMETKSEYASVVFKESEGKSREMMELEDYEEAGPNTNTKSGALPPPSKNSQPAPAPLA